MVEKELPERFQRVVVDKDILGWADSKKIWTFIPIGLSQK